MKIQEVTIEGYQSHTNSTFRLSPGLTVITGPSDAGKTAIIRALRWFAFNEPTGEAFLHTIRILVCIYKIQHKCLFIEFTADRETIFLSDKAVDVRITCTLTGNEGNLATGSEFILQPPIAGVTSITDTGTVVMAAERESLDAAWTRILDKAENPDTGGNVHDYERWVVDGFYKDYGVKVGKVLVDMCWNKDNGHDGRGTVRVVVVDDTYGPLDTSIVNDIKEYLDPKAYEGYGYGKAPGGAVVTVITGTPYDINISAHVEYEKNVDRAEVLQQFTELVTEYVKSRVFNRNDDTKELSPIVYKKIAAILGTLSGVANYDDLTVNGGTADITIEPYEIPTVKKVSLT